MADMCENCGKVFRADDAVSVPGDTFEFWGVSRTETEEACPFCKSTDLADYDEDDAEERCETPYSRADYYEDFYED